MGRWRKKGILKHRVKALGVGMGGRGEKKCHCNADEANELHGESEEVSEIEEGWSQHRQIG